MGRNGYTSVTLSDEQVTNKLDKIAADKRRESGGKWERPQVIEFLLNYYLKNGIDNEVKKGLNENN